MVDLRRIRSLVCKSVLFASVSLALMGCRTSVTKQIEADLWLIDHTDSTLYRVVKKPDGTEVEQFYQIPGNSNMKRFACMIDTDRKRWLELIERQCSCQ